VAVLVVLLIPLELCFRCHCGLPPEKKTRKATNAMAG
jgi:hypothetical protein